MPIKCEIRTNLTRIYFWQPLVQKNGWRMRWPRNKGWQYHGIIYVVYHDLYINGLPCYYRKIKQFLMKWSACSTCSNICIQPLQSVNSQKSSKFYFICKKKQLCCCRTDIKSQCLDGLESCGGVVTNLWTVTAFLRASSEYLSESTSECFFFNASSSICGRRSKCTQPQVLPPKNQNQSFLLWAATMHLLV